MLKRNLISTERKRAGLKKIFPVIPVLLSFLFAGCFLEPDRISPGAEEDADVSLPGQELTPDGTETVYSEPVQLTAETVRNCGGSLSGSFCLEEDLILEDVNITVDGTDVNICLKGHVLKGTGSGSVITVKNGGRLTVCDCYTESHQHVFKQTDDGWSWDDSASGDDVQTVYGGAVTGGSGKGGAVYVDGSFTLKGGSLAGNSSGNEYGGAVYLADGSFLMEYGVIMCNRGRKGGGVFVNGGVFTMEDGFIYRNSAGIDSGGAGIYDGSFIMKGGTVTENTSVMEGAGLYCRGQIYVGGKSSVAGNYRAAGGSRTCSDLYLCRDRTISLIEEKPLEKDSLIGISTQKKPAENSPVLLCETVQDLSEIFYSCSSIYETVRDGEKMILRIYGEQNE